MERMMSSGLRSFSKARSFAVSSTCCQVSETYKNQLSSSTVKTCKRFYNIHTNYFSGNPLERLSHKRSDPEWLKRCHKNEASSYFLFHKENPLAISTGDKMEMVQMRMTDLNEILGKDEINEHLNSAILLGVKQPSQDGSVSHGIFALDVSTVDVKTLESMKGGAKVLVNPLALLQLDPEDAAVCGQARSLLDWHKRHKFCSTCGSQTVLAEAGYKRICDNKTCLSHRGIYNSSYPRVDPSIITLIVSMDRDKCLLGRQRRFPPNMYSCLAGFIEPGESIEDACQREVKEEIGLQVTKIEYHSSQFWPMPSSLMIGLTAYSEQSKLKIDEKELEDARWFTWEEASAMLNKSHPDGLFIPPKQAIANHLIHEWVDGYRALSYLHGI